MRIQTLIYPSKCDERAYQKHINETIVLQLVDLKKVTTVHISPNRQSLVSWKDHISNYEVTGEGESSMWQVIGAGQSRKIKCGYNVNNDDEQE